MIEVMFAVRKDGFKVKIDFLMVKLQVFVCSCIFQELIAFCCYPREGD